MSSYAERIKIFRLGVIFVVSFAFLLFFISVASIDVFYMINRGSKVGNPYIYENVKFSDPSKLKFSHIGQSSYSVEGVCFCEPNEGERRNVATLKRGLTFVVVAVSSVLAHQLAKQRADDHCRRKFREDDCSNVRSEVEILDADYEILDADEDEGTSTRTEFEAGSGKYLCSGSCLPNRKLRDPQKREKAREHGCETMLIRDTIDLQKEEVTEIDAPNVEYYFWETILRDQCEEQSMVDEDGFMFTSCFGGETEEDFENCNIACSKVLGDIGEESNNFNTQGPQRAQRFHEGNRGGNSMMKRGGKGGGILGNLFGDFGFGGDEGDDFGDGKETVEEGPGGVKITRKEYTQGGQRVKVVKKEMGGDGSSFTISSSSTMFGGDGGGMMDDNDDMFGFGNIEKIFGDDDEEDGDFFGNNLIEYDSDEDDDKW